MRDWTDACSLEDFGETWEVVYAFVEDVDGGVEQLHAAPEGGHASFERHACRILSRPDNCASVCFDAFTSTW